MFMPNSMLLPQFAVFCVLTAPLDGLDFGLSPFFGGFNLEVNLGVTNQVVPTMDMWIHWDYQCGLPPPPTPHLKTTLNHHFLPAVGWIVNWSHCPWSSTKLLLLPFPWTDRTFKWCPSHHCNVMNISWLCHDGYWPFNIGSFLSLFWPSFHGFTPSLCHRMCDTIWCVAVSFVNNVHFSCGDS